MKTSFKCSQNEMYAVARLVFRSAIEFLKDFTPMKGRYKREYFDSLLLRVDEVQRIPDREARLEKAKSLRILLEPSHEIILEDWQYLKSYIEDAYPASLHKTKLEAAGQKYYAPASNFDWVSTKGIVVAAQNFMSENKDKLMEKENMPESFPAKFDKSANEFTIIYDDMGDARAEGPDLTSEKSVASEELYKNLMLVCRDGQLIFKKRPAVRNRFIFGDVLTQVRGSGTAGVKGVVIDSETKKPVNEIQIRVLDTDYGTLTDAEGKFDITPMVAKVYTVEFSGEGYETLLVKEQEVKIGTISRLDATLVKSKAY